MDNLTQQMAFDEVTLELKEESVRRERSVDRHYLLVWLDTLFYMRGLSKIVL
ncbi:hypothetical protein YC2023_094553 [Brassica napus]